MKCANCGKEIPENSKFCLECGKKILQEEFTCKKCGQALPAGAKFCNNCGENVNGTTAVSDNADTGIKIVIERKKQKFPNLLPSDIYLNGTFLGRVRDGAPIIHRLNRMESRSPIDVRVALLASSKKAANIYMTLMPSMENENIITVSQTLRALPDIEVAGFMVLSQTQTDFEKYVEPSK